MATTTVNHTVEEFEALNLGDDRHELWWGEVRPVPGGGVEHSGVGLRTGARLLAFAEAHSLGYVVGADCRFILDRASRLIFVPDVAFIATDRVPAGRAIRSSFEGPPELAVEIISPTDLLADVEEKARIWLRFGARMVWVLNPRRRTVAVWTPDGAIRTLGEADGLDGGEVVAGFRSPVAELFR